MRLTETVSQRRLRRRNEAAGIVITLSFAAVALSGCRGSNQQIASLVPPAPVAPPRMLAPSLPSLDAPPTSYAPNATPAGRAGDRDVVYLRWLGQYEMQRRQFDTLSHQRLTQFFQSLTRPGAAHDATTIASGVHAIVEPYSALDKQFAKVPPPPLCQPVAARYRDYLNAVAGDMKSAADAFLRDQTTANDRTRTDTGVSTAPMTGPAATAFNNTIAAFTQQHPELPPDIAGIRVLPS